MLKVSESVLSKHLSALASLHYINMRKDVHLGRRTTWISLTATGRSALASHVEALGQLIAGVPDERTESGKSG